MVTILCLGDSITYGTGSTPGYSYPEQMQRFLEAHGTAVKLVVDGHPGASTLDIWNYMESASLLPPAEAAFLTQPSYDAILLLLGTNDCRRDNWVETPQSIAWMELIIETLRHFLSTDGELYLCSVLPLADPMPGDIIGGQHPWVQAKVENELNPSLLALAHKQAVNWIDLHAAMQTALRQGLAVSDGIHPYDLGYELIARTCGESLLACWQGRN